MLEVDRRRLSDLIGNMAVESPPSFSDVSVFPKVTLYEAIGQRGVQPKPPSLILYWSRSFKACLSYS